MTAHTHHRPCYIGIDPAFRKNGFAMCIIDEENTVGFRQFRTFLDFLHWVFSEDAPHNAVVCIENSNRDQVMYAYHRSKRGQQMATAARNVGANQAISQCTADVCRWKWPKSTIDISPKEKGRKWGAKEAAQVAREYGHDIGRTNQDERDAYKLALLAKRRIYLRQ